MSTLYPLLTERRLVRPIWGGTELAAWLNLPEPRPDKLGETWEVYDQNRIINGPLAGRSLAGATQQYGAALVGTRAVERYGADFPLLSKFIDAADRLSIQVHPDDAYAHRHEAAAGFHGKTEAWYILSAAPGATVIYGLARPSSRAEFAAAIAAGRVDDLLRRLLVKAGDVIFVSAGTVHAIEAGIVLFEIQQKSDLTYRVYDYGRRDAATGQPRALHLDKALDVIDYAPAARAAIPHLDLGNGHVLLVACPFFALETWTLASEQSAATDPGTFEILTVLDGAGTLHAAGSAVSLRRGLSLVMPAALGTYSLQPEADETPPLRLLRATVPDLERDLLQPLRAKGLDETRLAQTILTD
jgi:mannose-6-phosphate isomerase